MSHTKDPDEPIEFSGDPQWIKDYLIDKDVPATEYTDAEIWGLLEKHLAKKTTLENILSLMAHDIKRGDLE